jgi:hypothetical protein
MDAKTKFQQSRYFLRNTCMNEIERVPVKIKIKSGKQLVNTNGSFFQIPQFSAVRGHVTGYGPTPALARRRMRYNERWGSI